MNKRLKDLSLVTLGAFIAALGFNGFMAENNIVSGGVAGLAISMSQLFGWHPGHFALAINVPLLLLCYLFLGKNVFISTLYGSWIFPIFINLTAGIPSLTDNQLLAAIFGSSIFGLGLGLVFLGNSSTGGTSIPIKILHKYSPLSLGVATIIVDGFVVLTGFIAFDVDSVLYSIIALVIISYVINAMVVGLETSKTIMVISEKYDAIKAIIAETADRGATEIPVVGGYTGQERRMLMVTALTIELPTIQRLITDIDPTAFMVIMPAHQVMGRGFSLTKNFQLADDDILPPL